MSNLATTATPDNRNVKPHAERSFSVRVPASTANLGAGFDCIGLALKLYLTVSARIVPEASVASRVRISGEGSDGALPNNEENLIFRAMRFTAEREGLSLPQLELDVHNELPLARGLGSSAAAIIAGITLASLVCERELSNETVLRYAVEMEGHSDNVAAAYLGGLVVTCLRPDGNVQAVKRSWPSELKVVVVSPEAFLKTAETRSVLPVNVQREDAVFNLQRVALFGAALEAGAYDLLWDAMQDRLHQAHRQSLVPGLAEALATPPQPGLLGIALSGSGPSVVALARDRSGDIGEAIADNFRRRDVPAKVRVLEVDDEGCTVTALA
ncbi:MAG TPA: homoserine kinase [Pyrinomonadaceae bacterium]|nr:homoserine kinase [Pyrinomonadaceae bacterium]